MAIIRKQNEIDSQFLKINILEWSRFARKCEIAVTECCDCDVIALELKRRFWFEFETKISIADFLRDFKKRKHSDYLKLGSCPNKFWFVLPNKIADEALKKLPIEYYKYGIIGISEAGGIYKVKKAEWIHKAQFGDWLLRASYMRLTNENISLRKESIKNKRKKHLEN